MTRIIEDGGKAYLIEEGRVVAASINKEALMPEKTAPFKTGDRVELNGKIGRVIASVPTIYGDTLSVRFDNGEFESTFPEDLKHSSVEEEIVQEDPITELVNEYEEYNKSVADTFEDVQSKSKIARSLNLRAKAMVNDPALSNLDLVTVDSIITATSIDIADLKNQSEELLEVKETRYLSSQPKYALADEVFGGSRWSLENSSWLDDAVKDLEEDQAATDWDAILAEEASILASHITSDDEEIIEANISQHFANTIVYEDKFDQFRSNVLTLLATKPVKVAKVENPVNLDEFSDEALFL